MGNKLSELALNAGKNTAKTINKAKRTAVNLMDQNDDGKFDLQDVSEMASTVGDAMKKGANFITENASEKNKQLETKVLRPIFKEDFDDADFLMPKFIRLSERDRKHSDSEVCAGSIGHFKNLKGMHLINIYRENIDLFGITLYPDAGHEFYYVDPADRNMYIALDEYFGYLKTARVSELQRIAHSLGAKHFKVTYKEEQTSFSERSKKVKDDIEYKDGKAKGNLEGQLVSNEKKYTTVEIAAEMECTGKAPVRPQVKYLQRDPNVLDLIEMRMDENSPITRQKFMLKLSNTSGMKEDDAAKIDFVLKQLKCSGNASVASEAKNEARRYLEYEIEF